MTKNEPVLQELALRKIAIINDNVLIIGRGYNEEPTLNMDMKFITVSDLDDLTSIKEIGDIKSFNLFPVPVLSGNKMTVSQRIIQGGIFDQNGRLINSLKDCNQINTGNIPPGTYFLTATVDGQKFTTKKMIIVDDSGN